MYPVMSSEQSHAHPSHKLKLGSVLLLFNCQNFLCSAELLEFLSNWCFQPSVINKAMYGLDFFYVTLAWNVTFWQLKQLQCTHHGITFVHSVPLIFT